MADVIRAEVVGRMLRPQELLAAREHLAAGAITRTEFKRIEDRAVDEAIALQERAGVEIVTDGELRRLSFVGPLTDTVDGVRPIEGARRSPGTTTRARSPTCSRRSSSDSRRAGHWRPRSTPTPAVARSCR